MMRVAELCAFASFCGGSHIDDACVQACELANSISAPVIFVFNGQVMRADPGTDSKSLSVLFKRSISEGGCGGILAAKAPQGEAVRYKQPDGRV